MTRQPEWITSKISSQQYEKKNCIHVSNCSFFNDRSYTHEHICNRTYTPCTSRQPTGPDKEIVCGERKKITGGFREGEESTRNTLNNVTASTKCNQSTPAAGVCRTVRTSFGFVLNVSKRINDPWFFFWFSIILLSSQVLFFLFNFVFFSLLVIVAESFRNDRTYRYLSSSGYR